MILAVLHTIGIVLLWILLILVILLAYLLLCPLWIRGQLEMEPAVYGKVRVFGFIHFWQIRYDAQGEAKGFKIFAFWGKVQLYPRREKGKAAPSHATSSDDAMAENEAHDFTDEKSTLTEAGSRKTDTDDTVSEIQTEEPDASDSIEGHASAEDVHTSKQSESSPEDSKAAQSENKHTGSDSQKHAVSPEEKQARKDKVRNIYQMVTNQQNQAGVSLIFKQLVSLLKSMHFNLRGTDLRYALGEPDSTGYLTGALSVLPFIYGPDIRFSPDFESDEAYAKGHITIRARLQLGKLVWVIIRIAANQDSRQLLKKLKSMKD